MATSEKSESKKSTRPIYSYAIPASIADGVTSVGLMELTAHEEIMSTKRASGDAFRLAYELAKQSLCEVNGQPVSLADGSVDTAFDKMPAKVRNLVLRAYAEIHTTNEDVAADFLKARQVRVG